MRSLVHSFRLPPVVAGALLIALAGCQDDAESPTAPASTPAPALEAATAAAVSFTQVSAGGSHTCGLAGDGRVYCWGLNENGQLGDGTQLSHSSPQVVSGTLRFVQVSAGAFHTCAVATDNRAYCWGDKEGLTPTAEAGGRRFVRVRAGTYHTCGVNAYHVGFCWGSKAFGELGGGDNYITPVRVARGLGFRSVIAGGGFTCGVTTGNKGYCWGYNLQHALGDGTGINRSKPMAVAGGLSFRTVIAGGGLIADLQGETVDETHACGLTTENLAYCWGDGTNGQLGDGSPDGSFTSNRATPFPVVGGLHFSQVIAGYFHTCGVTTTKATYYFGGNHSGQLGDGSPDGSFTSNRATPFPVVGGLHFSQVIAGYFHTCGVTTTKVAYCWGANRNGQLGDGTTSFGRSSPTKVAGGLLFAGVSTGPAGDHTCGITTGHKIYCWGDNAFGQLGDGTTTIRLSPVKVAGQS